jgi:homoserine O-acetyltransferase
MMSEVLEPTIEDDCTITGDTPFQLASGAELQSVGLRYALYGRLNRERNNAILVCHAMSGSARLADWWPKMFGRQGVFDPERYCVIGINVIGSCYGSTGPRSSDPRTGKSYGSQFPLVSIADMVRAQAELLDALGVRRLHTVIGGSIGGMQALQWAVDFPERVERCIALGAAPLSPMALALNHLQRQAIRNDPAWLNGDYGDEQPQKGLALARSIAVCTYKSPELFSERFGRNPNRNGEDPGRSLNDRYDVAGYLDHQGPSFTDRFDANSYLVLSKAMDTFDLARGYPSEGVALRRIGARVLMVGISSDWLFPASDILKLSERMRWAGVDASYAELSSSHGHDAFLTETDQLASLISPHLFEKSSDQVSSTRSVAMNLVRPFKAGTSQQDRQLRVATPETGPDSIVATRREMPCLTPGVKMPG